MSLLPSKSDVHTVAMRANSRDRPSFSAYSQQKYMQPNEPWSVVHALAGSQN